MQHAVSPNQPFRYNGRDGVQTDPNGSYYMRARYYDPKLKRFLNRDVIQGTITDGQTFNRYAYVNGDPVSNERVITKTTGGRIKAKVLTVAADKNTGEMFYGISRFEHNPTRLNKTHRILNNILEKKGVSDTNYPLENCAEFNAIHRTLLGRVRKLNDVHL